MRSSTEFGPLFAQVLTTAGPIDAIAWYVAVSLARPLATASVATRVPGLIDAIRPAHTEVKETEHVAA